MSYCPFCGGKLDSKGNCQSCGYTSSPNNDEILGEAVEKESKIIDDNRVYNNSGNSQNYSGGQNDAEQFFRQAEDYFTKDLNVWLKVLFVILSFVNVFLGFIIAIILLTSQYPRYKSFGIKLILLCIVLLVISFILGAFNLVIGIIFAGLRQITG